MSRSCPGCGRNRQSSATGLGSLSRPFLLSPGSRRAVGAVEPRDDDVDGCRSRWITQTARGRDRPQCSQPDDLVGVDSTDARISSSSHAHRLSSRALPASVPMTVLDSWRGGCAVPDAATFDTRLERRRGVRHFAARDTRSSRILTFGRRLELPLFFRELARSSWPSRRLSGAPLRARWLPALVIALPIATR